MLTVSIRNSLIIGSPSILDTIQLEGVRLVSPPYQEYHPGAGLFDGGISLDGQGRITPSRAITRVTEYINRRQGKTSCNLKCLVGQTSSSH